MLFPEVGAGACPYKSAIVAAEAYETTRAVTRLLRRSAHGRRAVTEPPLVSPGQASGRPVLLVHGLGGDASCFGSLEAKLNAAGFTTSCIEYTNHLPDIARCATALENAAVRLAVRTQAETLDVVAHSFGGIVLRWVVTHTQLSDRVRLAVTLGTPHRGTPAAFLAPTAVPRLGSLARKLRPGLPGFPGLADGSLGSTRWVTVAGRMDWIVPPAYAVLPSSANVRNLLVPNSGHMQLARSEECHRIVLDEVCAPDRDQMAA